MARSMAKEASKGRGKRSIAAAGVGASGMGEKLRRLRLRKGLMLRELADLVGCSESLISKIENGKALPSLSNLHLIVDALGTNVSSLFDQPGNPPDIVWRRDRRPVIGVGKSRRGGVMLEQLVAEDPERLLEAHIHCVPAGTGSDGTLRHQGEEMGYVLEGALELTVDGQTYRLEEGDSFAFRSEMSHSYRNVGRRTARIIWINTPPTF